MPDIWMDVDANVVVPMNLLPLTDDTDFKTVETALVYNSAGIKVYWNFVTTAGVMTTTEIHPTTSGVHDIAEPTADMGFYTIEIPSSGGDHANNDAEGVGWITGVATGMLPWRGPTIGFRRAALNDLLVDGGTASTNLEDFFDGTGYAGGTAKLTVDLTKVLGTAPTEGAAGRLAAGFTKAYDVATPVWTAASVNQTGDSYARLGSPAGASIAADIAAISATVTAGLAATVQAGSNVQTTGTLISGTYASTYLSNGVYWITAPVNPGGLDVYLQFTLGASQYVNSVTIRGYFNAAALRYCDVYAYNYGTSGWDQISDSTTRMNHATSNQTYTFTLLSSHRKADGEVRIRFASTSTTTTDRLNIDQCLVNVATAGASAADIAQATYNKLLTVVYEGGIWIDTVAGVAGTTLGVNGTIVNPVDTYASALTLASLLGVKRFYLKPGSSITLTQSHANWRFIGAGTIALGGQNIGSAVFEQCYSITGTGTGDDAEFSECGIGAVTIPHSYYRNCMMKGVFTTVTGDDYYFHNCSDAVAGGGTTEIVMKANANAYFRNWRGGLTVTDLAATNEVIVDGAGRVIIGATSTAGSIVIRGQFTITDQVSGGFVVGGGTLTDAARWAEDQSVASVTGAVTLTGDYDAAKSAASGVDLASVAGNLSDLQSQVGVAGAGLTALGDTRLANLDDTVSSRLAAIGYMIPPAVGDIADGVWDEAIADHTTPGSTAATLSGAGAAGDPWITPIPGAYPPGSAGSLLGTNVDAAVSTRLAAGDYTAPPSAADVATAVWGATTRTLSSFGTLVADIWAAATRTLTAFAFNVGLTSAYDAAKTAAQAGNAMTLTVGERTSIADALLTRDLSLVTGEASRSLINAARSLRNKVVISAGTITVYKEDDSTPAWTGTVTTDDTADPVTGVDPA